MKKSPKTVVFLTALGIAKLTYLHVRGENCVFTLKELGAEMRKLRPRFSVTSLYCSPVLRCSLAVQSSCFAKTIGIANNF